jgi:hypothetical protein
MQSSSEVVDCHAVSPSNCTTTNLILRINNQARLSFELLLLFVVQTMIGMEGTIVCEQTMNEAAGQRPW